MVKLITHPFREAIQAIIREHFAPSIAKNFYLEFEANTFTKDLLQIRNQMRDDNYVLEVRYQNPNGAMEFICDVYSWASKKETEARLLRYITDKVVAGKIGYDWVEENGKLEVSKEIRSRKYETEDEPTIGH